MRIGIYLGYGPDTILGKEGLGRYLGGLLHGFVEQGHQVVIALPKWTEETLRDLCKDFQVDMGQVVFAEVENLPVTWQIRQFLKGPKKQPRESRKEQLYQAIARLMKTGLSYLIQVTSLGVLLAGAVLLFLAMIMVLPLVLAFAVCYFVLFCVKNFGKFGKKTAKKGIRRLVDIFNRFSKTGQSLGEFIYEKTVIQVRKQVVEKANRQDVDVWFVPGIFWPEVAELKGTCVINVPDVVTLEFPELCSDDNSFSISTEICCETIRKGTKFITYCDYIKESVVQNRFGKANVVTIPHANHDLAYYVTIPDFVQEKLNANKDFSKAFASSILSSQLPMHCLYAPSYYLSFGEVEYIFYASQNRPYKNILSLLRAYEYLLRKKYISAKLFLTCDLKVYNATWDFVAENKLQMDVLCFYNVDAQTLAALYKCAALVVNPTFYEGGFPFTFGEGMSVGTPSVMSDIPQVRDVVEPYGLCDAMLFDPYDWQSMADKIEYGLAHRQELYELEFPLYQDQAKRTDSVVAAEYVAAFEKFIREDQEKKNEQKNAG